MEPAINFKNITCQTHSIGATVPRRLGFLSSNLLEWYFSEKEFRLRSKLGTVELNLMKTKIVTRAKKLVWQSSRLAPLVCKFGWAMVCVFPYEKRTGGFTSMSETRVSTSRRMRKERMRMRRRKRWLLGKFVKRATTAIPTAPHFTKPKPSVSWDTFQWRLSWRLGRTPIRSPIGSRKGHVTSSFPFG